MGLFTEKEKQESPSPDLKGVGTFISSSANIEGKITGKENIDVAGIFLGTLKIVGNLNILEPAEIEGEVEATNIIIKGKIKGKVAASEKIELTKTAQVRADIDAKIISVEAGAVLRGKYNTRTIEENQMVE